MPGTWPYHIQTFAFGQAASKQLIFIALQDEVFTEYGLNLKKVLPQDSVIVCGYSNNMTTYVCTARAIAEGGYEPTAYRYEKPIPAGYAPQAEQLILDTAAKMVKVAK